MADNDTIEVQIEHEKTEWAYCTYVMSLNDGCLSSNRFEYDADKLGDKERARRDALESFINLQMDYPRAHPVRNL